MSEIFSFLFSPFSRKKEHGLKTLYAALFILSFHWSLVIFIESSYLEQFFSVPQVGLLFVIASVLLLLPFLYMSRLLRAVGNFNLIIFFTAIEAIALVGMALALDPAYAVAFFMLHFTVGPLIFFNIDIFIEAIIGSQEKQTGRMRSIYLVLLSVSGAIAPIITGELITKGGAASFHVVYLASAILLIPFLGVISLYFSEFKDPKYPRNSVKSLITTFVKERDIRNVFISHLFLQFFFTWMTIYTPLYLATHAGFSWIEISYIVFAGLLAYVICEYPIGVIADKYLGEKEMMAFGFFLIAVSTSWLAFLPAGSLIMWMAVMFLTRVGASFVEVTTESYFFKHTKSDDSDKISLFRGARPLGSVVGSVLGSMILLQIEFSFMFILLGIFMLPGIFFTLLLRDTR